jgi:membrane-associated PAP2 superfamily phosphatase
MQNRRPFSLRPQLFVVLALALAGWMAGASGLDAAIAQALFDPAMADFPAHRSAVLETVGHHLAKSAVWIVWFVLVGAAIASHRVERLAPARRALWAAVIAMALGPATVATLKLFTGPRCPWDLVEFGGHGRQVAEWFVGRAEAGHCFPAGHAAGGFSLIALHFAGLATGDARLRRTGLWAGIACGIAFGAVRMVQGAHFLSHNLWAAAVVWAVAAAVFAIAFRAPAAAEPAAAQPRRPRAPERSA